MVNPAAVSESTSPLEALKILGADPTPDSLAEPQFLQPDAAFRLNTQVLGGNTLMIRWQIADTYYLYRNKFKFTLRDSPGIQLQSISIPPGKIKKDPYFGNVEVFFNTAQATIKLAQHAVESNKLNLEVGYQGCTELGLCYPPITRQLSVTLPATVQ